MIKCPFCENEIDDDGYYCDQCGNELKLCIYGHGFKKGNICSICGQPLKPVRFNDTKNSDSVESDHETSSDPNLKNHDMRSNPDIPSSTSLDINPKLQYDQSIDTEKTSHPHSLFNKKLDVHIELKHGAIIGRCIGDYLSIFGSQPYISGKHACFQLNTIGDWELIDLGSTNGTFVNGQQIKPYQPITLKLKDKIAFYDCEFIVE